MLMTAVALRRAKVAGFYSAHVDNDSLEHYPGVTHADFERVVPAIPNAVTGIGFTNAVFHRCFPGLEREIREHIDHLRRLIIERDGIPQPATGNEIQGWRGDHLYLRCSAFEKIHLVFETRRCLWRQNTRSGIGNNTH